MYKFAFGMEQDCRPIESRQYGKTMYLIKTCLHRPVIMLILYQVFSASSIKHQQVYSNMHFDSIPLKNVLLVLDSS